MIKNIDDGKRRNRKEDIYWEYLFEKFNILDAIEKHGTFEITADIIKDYCKPKNIHSVKLAKGSEARLMVKWDSISTLPNIFKKHNITVLPIGDGRYTLGRFSVYNQLNIAESLNETIKELSLPSYITTLSPESVRTEAQALNAADISGMFNDFLDEKRMKQPHSGIYTSGIFNFVVNDMESDKRHMIRVDGTQVEVDTTFESDDNFYVVEGKSKLQSDFSARQLFYPYKVFQQKTYKPVYPVFFFFDKGIYNLSLYKVEDENDFNSLRLIKRQNYRLVN